MASGTREEIHKMGLNAAQKEAVEYLDGPLLVLAGPGTGKTQLLSEKVAYILKNTDTNPENILCLTFTEVGAANMRERLASMIKNDALKVNISTYHAFGAEILAQYRHYSETYERQLDAAIDEVTQYKIVKELQDKLPARDILRGDKVRDIISVISEAKGANLTAEDLAMIAEQNLADAETLGLAISPLLGNIVPRKFRESYEQAYRPIFAVLESYQDTAPILKNVERSIAGMARDLAEVINEAEASEKIKPLTAWKDKYFERDEKGRYRLKDRVANRKLQSVAKLMAAYEKYLRKNGLYDFDDMIQEAVRVLKTDQGFRLTLEERYQMILLDEFQDTNPAQFAIVKELTDYEKPLVMAVGDDDQAIYEFQGAMSSNLREFEQYYQAKVVTLTENYRSTQEILDFAREIIRQAPDRFADKKLVAHRVKPPKTEIYRYEFAGADAEYAFVAEKIAGLVAARVPQSEIAVIAHKRKYFEPLLAYLKEYPELKIAYDRRDNLLEEPKIHEILTILRLVDDLAQERRPSGQLMEILTFDWLDLPVLEVLKLSAEAREKHQGMFESLNEMDPEKYEAAAQFKAVAEWLGELVKMSFDEPIEVVVNKIVEKMENYAPEIVDASTISEYEKFHFYENLAALMGKLKHYAGDKKLRVADLLQMADDYETAEMQLTAHSPYRDAEEAVQILTAHKAKGLEFGHVFVISADHTAWGKGKGNNNLLTLPKNLQQIRHTGITDSERLRVLYVALTRAKQVLYITNALRDFNEKSPERLEYLQETVETTDKGEKVISPFLPSREVVLEYNLPVPIRRVQNLRNWLSAYRPNSPEMRAIYRDRMKNWRMSASALTSFIDVVYAGPEEFFKNYVLRAPHEPETVALALGDLIHQTFEAVTNLGISDAEALEFYQARLAEKDLATEVATEIRERGVQDLQKALAEFGGVLRQGAAEVDFASEKLAIAGVPVTGKIDHLIVDEQNKTIEIYDFKTGGYYSQKWHSHATLYKYMLQLGFYKLLLNNSPRYRQYKVEKAHILFVTPDQKDGEVHDKIYEFNEEDEKALMELMQAIYRTVSTLEFLDDAELMIAPSKTRTLKDIKNFVKLVTEKNTGKS